MSGRRSRARTGISSRTRSRSRSRSNSEERNRRRRRLPSARQTDDTRLGLAGHWRDVREETKESYTDWRRRNRTIRTPHLITFPLHNAALNLNFQTYDIDFADPTGYGDLQLFLRLLEGHLRQQLQHLWMTYGAISWAITLNVQYEMPGTDETPRMTRLASSYQLIHTYSDINSTLDIVLGEIDTLNNNYEESGSGWVFVNMLPGCRLNVRQLRYSQNVRGGGQHFGLLNAPGRAFIDLPRWVRLQHACINIKNDDNLCFIYAMELAYNTKHGIVQQHRERVYHYQTHHFDYGDLTFPLHVRDIPKFERLNYHQHKLAINVYHANSYEDKQVHVLYHNKDYESDTWRIHLLFIDNKMFPRDVQTDAHWVYINDLQNLLRAGQARTRSRRYLCERCLRDFNSQATLDKHTRNFCFQQESQSMSLPLKCDAYKYFRTVEKMTAKPCVIYADFEAFNKEIDHRPTDNETQNERNRQTHHIAASYAFYLVWHDKPHLNRTYHYNYATRGWNAEGGTNVGEHFINSLSNIRTQIYDTIKDNYEYPLHPDTLTEAQRLQCNQALNCCICGLLMRDGGMRHWNWTIYNGKNYKCSNREDCTCDYDNDRCYYGFTYGMTKRNFYKELKKKDKMDASLASQILAHNIQPMVAHYPEKEHNNFRGVCHSACYSKLTSYGRIPVVFHSFTSYDSHLIIQALKREHFQSESYDDVFNAIPQPGHKFMSFSFNGFQFVDSWRFVGEKLEVLTKNLLKGGVDQFVHTNREMQRYLHDTYGVDYTDEVRLMLLQKGVFPYDYFNHPRVFDQTSLPAIEAFYNELNEEECDPSSYAHAQKVWRDLRLNTFEDYHDVYLYQDVYLLADIFERFRQLCRQENNLEPLHYFSLPGYSFDSALLHSNKHPHIGTDGRTYPFQIELFAQGQEEMYQFMEEAIRGGVSMTPGRYAKANHKFLPDYDEKLPSKFIQYWDANNLYGWAMNQPLPYGGYKWITSLAESNTIFNTLASIPADSPLGYFLEIDGYFPDEKHDELRDFPPAPLKAAVPADWTSKYYKNLCTQFDLKHDSETVKLLCTLYPRERYKVHYRCLQLYQRLGFVVTKVHRILQFKQAPWLVDYIMYNTNKRAAAPSWNKFLKDFYKLLNNSVYGKFIQNNRRFESVQALFDPDAKANWDPHLKDWYIVNEGLVLAYMKKGQATLNSAVIVGATVLEYAKYLMYEFWYEKLKPVFGNRIHLQFTDTDSLCVAVETDDIMAEIKAKGLAKDFDLADWPNDTSYHGANYHDPSNNKVIGKFKDEMSEKRNYITEEIALRSKMYSLHNLHPEQGDQDDPHQKATAKGVKRHIKRHLRHESYRACHQAQAGYVLNRQEMHSIQSVDNQLYSTTTNKTTLNPADSKLYINSPNSTYPYGHYAIRPLAA